MGPTNTRLYTVAVYFKGKRLAQASGHSIQQAEMNSAKQALEISQSKILISEKRVLELIIAGYTISGLIYIYRMSVKT